MGCSSSSIQPISAIDTKPLNQFLDVCIVPTICVQSPSEVPQATHEISYFNSPSQLEGCDGNKQLSSRILRANSVSRSKYSASAANESIRINTVKGVGSGPADFDSGLEKVLLSASTKSSGSNLRNDRISFPEYSSKTPSRSESLRTSKERVKDCLIPSSQPRKLSKFSAACQDVQALIKVKESALKCSTSPMLAAAIKQSSPSTAIHRRRLRSEVNIFDKLRIPDNQKIIIAPLQVKPRDDSITTHHPSSKCSIIRKSYDLKEQKNLRRHFERIEEKIMDISEVFNKSQEDLH